MHPVYNHQAESESLGSKGMLGPWSEAICSTNPAQDVTAVNIEEYHPEGAIKKRVHATSAAKERVYAADAANSSAAIFA